MPAYLESVSRFICPPRGSFFLFGPRGTGKSTWVKDQFPLAPCLNLLHAPTEHQYTAHPEHLKNWVEGQAGAKEIIIDEIQKVPALLDMVHLLIEEKKNRRFVLTGSSARKLMRGGANLLGGRAANATLHPFMAAELKGAFRFEKALSQGLLPIVWSSADPEETLSAYAGMYLREEVKMEGLVRNIGHFSRFMEAVSFSHGSVLNISNVARECHVERKTVSSFVDILEDLLLCFRLPVFTKRAKRELVGHPKFYYFDTGVFRSLRPRGPLDRSEEIEGPALEGLVAQHMRAWIAYRAEGETLSFWQTRWGTEVDFIVYGPKTFCAIEVKNTHRVRPADLAGLKEFCKDFPEATPFLLYRGAERLRYGPIRCLPCNDFLTQLHPGSALSKMV